SVARGSDGVVPCPALLDPDRGRRRVQVSRQLCVLDGVTGQLDPDVRPPHGILAWSADEVADELACMQSGRPGRARPAPCLFELFAGGGRVFEPTRQEGLRLPVTRMPLREQARGALDLRLVERAELQPGHAA